MKLDKWLLARSRVIYFVVFAVIFTSVLSYQPKTAQAMDYWSTGTAGGTARNFHTSEAYNGKIYSWGGGMVGNLINTLEIYDIASGTWTNGQSGGTPRAAHGSAIYNGDIYFWGGCADDVCINDLNTMDIYNIAGNSWTTGLAGGTGRSFFSSAIYNGNIYFWGGRENNTAILNTMDIYNIAGNSWTTGLTGGRARQAHTSVAYNGNIFFWGGCGEIDMGFCVDTNNTLDIYNIAGNSWTIGQAGGTARSIHTSVLSDGKIYSWGGLDAELELLNTINIYDIVGETWSTGTAGGTARLAHTSVLSDDKIYSLGGAAGPDWDDTNTVDIYDISFQAAASFANLPGDDSPVNLDEGGVITESNYTINVKPAGTGITKVEFYVDNTLICTDSSSDANGVYSCVWDTTKYHSSIRIVAFYVDGTQVALTRNVVVRSASTSTAIGLTVLPEVGLSRLNLRDFFIK